MADVLATSTHDAHAHDTSAALGLTSDEIDHLQQQAIAYASSHGMLIGKPASGDAAFTHIPLSLLPVPFPQRHFAHGVALSPVFGRLVDRVSRDLDWLHETLQKVVTGDAFTARLLQISQEIQAQGIQQRAYLGVLRSDYMLHEPQAEVVDDTQRLLQVELNTIASSFGCISSLISELHKYLTERMAGEVPALAAYYHKKVEQLVDCLPDNHAIEMIPSAIAQAHKHYGRSDTIVVFVVQPREANSVDQRWIEFKLWTNHRIRVVRKTLAEIDASARLQDRDGKRVLVIDKQEVAVVYFRAGYTPRDYPTEQEWAARMLIEQSYAIKCPSIAYHLAGTKKVQQALAEPSMLRRFISEDDARLLESSFAGLYGLDQDSPKTDEIKAMAVAAPSRYVLKPQREGGGNNWYDEEIVDALLRLSPSELEAYILMERIFPAETEAILVRDGKIATGPTISELGMFITTLFDDGREVLNVHAGHLLRTKLATTNEGGVATGFSVVSSPLLI